MVIGLAIDFYEVPTAWGDLRKCTTGFRQICSNLSPCTNCVAGTYSAAADSVCTDCLAGKFFGVPEQTSIHFCTNCVAGTYAAAGAGRLSVFPTHVRD